MPVNVYELEQQQNQQQQQDFPGNTPLAMYAFEQQLQQHQHQHQQHYSFLNTPAAVNGGLAGDCPQQEQVIGANPAPCNLFLTPAKSGRGTVSMGLHLGMRSTWQRSLVRATQPGVGTKKMSPFKLGPSVMQQLQR